MRLKLGLVTALLASLLAGCLTVNVGNAPAPQAGGGVLDVSWTAPTTNTDNTPLSDLASYRVYYAVAPATPCPGATYATVNSQTTTPSANTTVTTTLQGLTVGTTYNVMVTAVDTSGLESACSAVASAPARQNPTPVTNQLTVNKTGSAASTGTVTSNPTGISCGATCSAGFVSTQSVDLTAVPASGTFFTGWSGDCTGTSTTCSAVPMTANRTATAAFAKGSTLAVTISGSGTVTSSSAWGGPGITCPGTCSASFPDTSTVTLTPVPASGYVFTGWSGGCTGTAGCTLPMTGNWTVTATFAPAYTMTVNFAGTGTGATDSQPGGLHCHGPNPCVGTYPPNTQVTITATADTGSTFAGWTGACTGTGPCVVTLGSNQSATATFNAAPTSDLIFGDNVIGTSNVGSLGCIAQPQTAALSAAGTLKSLSIYVAGQAGSQMALALYDTSGANGSAGKLLAQTPAFYTVSGWNTQVPTTTPALAPGTYWLVWWMNSNNTQLSKTTKPNTALWACLTSMPFPATWPTTNLHTSVGTFSYYGTVTVTAPPQKNGQIQNPQLKFTSP